MNNKCNHTIQLAGKKCRHCDKKFPKLKGASTNSKYSTIMEKAPQKR